MLFHILGPISLPVVVGQTDERHANRTASMLEWYDRHRAYNIWFKRRSVCTLHNRKKLHLDYVRHKSFSHLASFAESALFFIVGSRVSLSLSFKYLNYKRSVGI